MTVHLPTAHHRLALNARRLLTDDDPSQFRPNCEHQDVTAALRTMITRGGVKQFKFECQICGRRGSAIPRTHRIVANLEDDPPLVNEEIGKRFWESKLAEMKQARDEERAEWWRRYELYLESDKWKRKRKRVLIRDRYQCQAAMDGCLNDATEVHHLTYQHVFNEPLFELIAVCSRCHEKITALDRERNAA